MTADRLTPGMLADLADRFARGGSADPPPGVTVHAASRWVPIASEHGPYDLRIPGLDHEPGTAAGDASVQDGPGTIAAWAAVASDGRARIGWYTAGRVNTISAELEAIRQALAMHPPARPVTVFTDNASARDVAERLAAGGRLKGLPRGVLHHEHAAAARDQLRSRPVTLRVIAARNPSGRMSPTHHLLGPADRLAHLALRVAVDGIPVTPDVCEALAGLVAGRRHRDILNRAYARWKGGRP